MNVWYKYYYFIFYDFFFAYIINVNVNIYYKINEVEISKVIHPLPTSDMFLFDIIVII